MQTGNRLLPWTLPVGRRTAYLVIIGILALSALGGWTFLRDQDRVEYRIARVQRGEIDATVSATGNPNAVITVQVGSQVSGNINALYADFNAKVRKGQLVARIAPEVFEAKVDQAKANLDNVRASVLNAMAMLRKTEADVAGATASLEAARANVVKAKVAVLDAKVKLASRLDLFKEGRIPAEERDSVQAAHDANVAVLDASQAQEQAARSSLRAAQAMHEVAKAQVASAEAQVKQAEAVRKQAQVDLEHTYIRAPVDGTVVSRNVDVGQTVAASLQAPILFLIAQDLTKMQVNTNVDEADVGRIRVGQAATFTVDAFAEEIFKGKVVQIRQAPMNVQNVITYDAVVAVSNPNLKLFPGMTANVKILVDRRESALKIPSAALRFRPTGLKEELKRGGEGPIRTSQGPPMAASGSGGRSDQGMIRDSLVWVLGVDKKPKPVEVRLGITDGSFSEVIEGDLRESQEVIVGIASGAGSSTRQTQPFGQRRLGL